ncbi:MAG: MurR/RpiR family transcriptional regulator [Deltaproteobacteria bacterium]|nr:MurR/RpiR family transcriptional regulator [Deltaproteobacteria bacterium]
MPLHSLILKKKLCLTKSQKMIVKYVMDNYDEVLFMTCFKLARNVGVSETSIIRLAQTLGFKGYPGMQRYLRASLKSRLSTVIRLEKSISHGSSVADVFTKNIRQDIINLTRTLQEMPIKALQEAVDSILAARCVYFIGMRGAHAPALILSIYLRFLNRNVVLITPGYGDVWNSIYTIGKEDLAVAISIPRYYRLTVELLEYAHNKGAKTGAITDSALSPLARYAQWVLPVHCQLDSFIESYTAAVSVASALVTAVSMNNPKETMDELKKHEELWKEKKDLINPMRHLPFYEPKYKK